MIASDRGDEEVVRELLQQGAEVRLKVRVILGLGLRVTPESGLHSQIRFWLQQAGSLKG